MQYSHIENDSTWMGKIKEDSEKPERHFTLMNWKNQAGQLSISNQIDLQMQYNPGMCPVGPFKIKIPS